MGYKRWKQADNKGLVINCPTDKDIIHFQQIGGARIAVDINPTKPDRVYWVCDARRGNKYEVKK